MAPVEAGWRALQPLQDRSDEFLAFVEGYLPQVQALTDDQQRTLALFKSAELVNALLQIRERRQSEDRFGTALAQASFDVVRRAIRNRRLVLVDGEVVDLHAPPIRALIDEGCRLFHAPVQTLNILINSQVAGELICHLSLFAQCHLSAFRSECTSSCRFFTQPGILFPTKQQQSAPLTTPQCTQHLVHHRDTSRPTR